ncbi:MAG: response regulator [Thermodesulfobacteriota bacterium]|nr:response regulator [Thermodesulfobacteriota bacterium]
MYKIVIATSRKDDFGKFGKALETAEKSISLQWVRSGSDALAVASEIPPDLLIADEILDDMEGLTLIRKLLGINAMINTALASPLSASEFHEATEGLGILSNLPVVPGETDARAIFTRLVEVVGPKP